MPHPSSVLDIVNRFGGRDKFAELVLPALPGAKRRVKTWIDYDLIPGGYMADVRDAARKAGIVVTADELAEIARAKRYQRAA